MAGKKFTFKKKVTKRPSVGHPSWDKIPEEDSLDSDLEDFQFLMKSERCIAESRDSTSLNANDLAAIITTHSSTSWSLPEPDSVNKSIPQSCSEVGNGVSEKVSAEIKCDEEVTIVKQTNPDSSKFSFASIRSRVVQQKNEEAKNAWKDLMVTMRCKSAPVVNDSKTAWKGLMTKMQGKPAAAAGRNAPKRQAKGKLSSFESRTVTKKIKSETTVAASTSRSSFDAASEKLELETTIAELEEVDKSITKDSNSSNLKVPTRICPLFTMFKKSTTTVTATKADNVKPWDLVHTDNPWLCDSDLEKQVPTQLTLNENSSGLPGEREKTKKCPFYKFMPDSRMSVDAFDWGVLPNVEVYLLSHFHADHYGGLTRNFNKTIVCSRPTGNLVKHKLGVAEECIRRLDLNRRYIIDGVELVLIDANHCPGSVMFILRLRSGKVYLHTGDFRYTPEMIASRFLENLKVDCLYLDTTYLDPQYVFPGQSEAIKEAIKAVKKHISYRPKTLILCGTYCIGKERVFCAVADAIGSKAFCLRHKRLVIEATENQYFIDTLSDYEDECQVHVVPMQTLNPKALQEYLSVRTSKYTNVLAIKPTGWEFSRGVGTTTTGSRLKSHHNDTVHILGIPYSEHSSFEELRQFVKAVRPAKIQPTVNVGNPAKRNNMMQHLNSWMED